MIRALGASVLAMSTAAVLAACGPQTDARVASSSAAPSSAASADAAAASPVASAAAPDASPTAPQPPFQLVDCLTGQVAASTSAPDGTTSGPVTVTMDDKGIPVITVAEGAADPAKVIVTDIVEGKGAAVTAADTITVDYCGVNELTRQLLDSSWARGEAATFALSGLIPGWQQGIPGMRPGGTRLLEIPAKDAYGDAPLAFVIKLASIN